MLVYYIWQVLRRKYLLFLSNLNLHVRIWCIWICDYVLFWELGHLITICGCSVINCRFVWILRTSTLGYFVYSFLFLIPECLLLHTWKNIERFYSSYRTRLLRVEGSQGRFDNSNSGSLFNWWTLNVFRLLEVYWTRLFYLINFELVEMMTSSYPMSLLIGIIICTCCHI